MECLNDVFLPCPVNINHPLARLLVGWWIALPGLEGGRMIYNIAPHKWTTNGVLVNGVRWAESPFGAALDFNGVVGRVDCSGDENFEVGPFYPIVQGILDMGMSVASMARSNSFGTDEYQQCLMSAGDNFHYTFVLSCGGGVTSFLNWNGTTTSTDPPVELGSWNTHVGTSRGGTSAPTAVYTNGIKNHSTGGTSFSTVRNGGKFYIGRRYDAIGGRPTFDGQIQSTMLWNRELSSGEVADLNILMRNGYIGLLNRFTPTKLVFNIPVSATMTAVCTMTAGLTSSVIPGDGDIYDPENLRGMFNFLLPIVNQELHTNYTTCDVKFVFANGREVRFPDCD